MDCEFHLQDPTSPDTVYLFEAIIEAAHEAESCTGLFAFASRAGVDSREAISIFRFMLASP